MRMADSGEYTPEQLAAEVYSCLARTIEKLLTNAAKETGLRNVLLAAWFLRRDSVKCCWNAFAAIIARFMPILPARNIPVITPWAWQCWAKINS